MKSVSATHWVDFDREKTGTSCQVSKEIGREKKLCHSPWFYKHVFKSSPKKKKKKLLSALVDNKNLSVRHLMLKHTMF